MRWRSSGEVHLRRHQLRARARRCTAAEDEDLNERCRRVRRANATGCVTRRQSREKSPFLFQRAVLHVFLIASEVVQRDSFGTSVDLLESGANNELSPHASGREYGKLVGTAGRFFEIHVRRITVTA